VAASQAWYRRLKQRGLAGVRLVTADDHAGRPNPLPRGTRRGTERRGEPAAAGRARLARAVARLARDVGMRTVALDVPPLGQPRYACAGFAPAWGLQRWAGQAPPVAGPPEARPLRAADRAWRLTACGFAPPRPFLRM
jgi:hypothetical protein